MIKETIQAVEDAEAKASELVAQASEDARRVKAEAEAEADRMLADAQKRGKEAAVKQEEELTLRGEPRRSVRRSERRRTDGNRRWLTGS